MSFRDERWFVFFLWMCSFRVLLVLSYLSLFFISFPQISSLPTIVKSLISHSIFSCSSEQNRWIDVESLEAHSDWVRDVSFAPNIGLPRSYLASASQDRTVCIWTQDTPGSTWTKTFLNPSSSSSTNTTSTTTNVNGKFPDTVWRVSWSVSGNVLAVSCGDGKISLWKENLKGAWECVSEMDS